MHKKSLTAHTLLLIGLTAAGTSQAASLSYVIDQSSSMTDNIGYFQVTLSDGVAGAIDFAVKMMDPLLSVAGPEFGMQKFSFNVVPNGNAEAMDVTGLPDGWKARDGGKVKGFGNFDITLKGDDGHRLSELTFSLTGIDGDQLTDYVSLSTGRVKEMHSLFAAKVHGLAVADLRSVSTFGGSTAATVVPLPAAVWLLGSGLGLLGGVARRTRKGTFTGA